MLYLFHNASNISKGFVMKWKKENNNIYFVTASIIASLVFYAVTLVAAQQDIANGSSLKTYRAQQMQQ